MSTDRPTEEARRVPPGERCTFPKSSRLRTRKEFLAVQRSGKRRPTAHFLLVRSPNAGGPTRLGVTVTRKIGNAVVRNRLKRAVREAFRHRRTHFRAGFDVVVIARRGSEALAPLAIVDEVAAALDAAVGLPENP